MPGTFNTSDFDEESENIEEDDENIDNTNPYGEDETPYDIDQALLEDEENYGALTSDDEYQGFLNSAKKTEREQYLSRMKKSTQSRGKLLAKAPVKKTQKFNVARAKKDSVAKILSPAIEGICPFCHKKSIHKSYRPMDLLIFTGISALLTAGGGRISTFYCMNRKCKYSYWKNYCFRCGGDRWVGAKAPWKRIAGVDM